MSPHPGTNNMVWVWWIGWYGRLQYTFKSLPWLLKRVLGFQMCWHIPRTVYKYVLETVFIFFFFWVIVSHCSLKSEWEMEVVLFQVRSWNSGMQCMCYGWNLRRFVTQQIKVACRGYPAKRALPAMRNMADRALLAGYPPCMSNVSVVWFS